MKRIEAFIRGHKLEGVKLALNEVGIGGLTAVEVRGYGRQKGHTEVYRGSEYAVDLVPKVMLLIFVPDEMAPKVVECILKTAKTGQAGDGKVFVSNLEHVFRVRTDESGEGVL